LAGVGAVAPSRNGLSHANKVRPAEFIEKLFWRVRERLQTLDPSFAAGRRGRGLLRRFRVRIHAVDSTVMELVFNCIDWAKHRRRKAAAKMHLRQDLHSFLPSFAIVDTAGEHDNKRAREVCAGIEAGEIVVFDKAYVDFDHLADLDAREVWWVTRAKDNMRFRVRRNLAKDEGKIVRDQMVQIDGGRVVRRVEAWVEVDGEERLLVFITNNPNWSPTSVCDLYRRRWDIEVFFKQVKQTLKLGTFLGHSANAVRWQVYSALLIYVLLRFQACGRRRKCRANRAVCRSVWKRDPRSRVGNPSRFGRREQDAGGGILRKKVKFHRRVPRRPFSTRTRTPLTPSDRKLS